MKCAQCGHENQPDFNFCEECATPLVADKPPCPACGHPNQPDFNFCEQCAIALKAEEIPQKPSIEEPETLTKVAVEPESEVVLDTPAEPTHQPDYPAPEPLPPAPEPVVAATSHAKPVPTAPKISTGAACTTCGFVNPIGIRFCGQCGQEVGAKPAKRKPKLLARLLRFVVSLISSLLVAALTTLVTRYAVPHVLDLINDMQASGISEQEAVRQADNFVRAEYDDFLGVSPSVQKALDGQREVYVVAYNRSGATLAVIVDATTGSARLLPPDR